MITVRPSAHDLGLEVMTLEEFRDEAARLPFEPAMFVASLMSSRIWPIWTDGPKQLELAVEMWGEIPLVQIFRTFLERHPDGVPFSQHQTAIAQRVLIDYAPDGTLGEELTQDQVLALTRILVHAHDLADASHDRLERGQASLMEVLAYVMQVGAYYERPALLNTFARSYDLFLERARARDDQTLPLDEWSTLDYETTLEEQLAGGFGYAAAAHAFDDYSAKRLVLLDNHPGGPGRRPARDAPCERTLDSVGIRWLDPARRGERRSSITMRTRSANAGRGGSNERALHA